MAWSRSASLCGERVLLRPLVREDATALVEAASDGELWSSKVTVVPDRASAEEYTRRST